MFHVTATTSSNSTLSAKDFVQKITGNLNRLPSKLSVFTPRQIVGNIYDNGQYFIALQGSVEGGKIYVLFYKGKGGLKAGVAASMTSIKLSEVVKGTSGIDVGSVPFLGQLVVYSIALSITSGEIQSPTLPHIFGSNSPLHSFGDTLRAGAIATFKLDIGKVKGVLGRFDGAVVTIKLVECSLQYLSSVIPGLSDAVKTLPKELKSAFSTRLTLIRYNITSKQISLSGVLKSQSIVPDVLSLSNVHITIVVALGKTIALKSVEYKGTWKIGAYSINTVVVCDVTTKKIDVSGQAEGTLNVNTEKFLETIAGNDLVLPSSLSSFTITSITGRILPTETLIVFNGKVGSNSKISVVVYRRSERIELAVAADIPSFKLADLVRSGTGVDVSSVPLIGSIIIPDLKFAAATNNITSKLLSGLASKGSAIEAYKNGLHKGISGRFIVKISGADNVVVEFAHKRLLFKIPTTAPLTVQALLSNIPKVKSSVQKLPSETSSVLSATVTSFTYDPVSTRMKFGGGIGSKVVIVPDFVTLTSVSVSVNVLLGPKYSVEKVDITGNWVLNNKLPIRTTISYSSSDTTLRLSGQLKSDVNLNEFIKLLSRESLPIPKSLPTSVTLTKLVGNKIGDTTLIMLSGNVGSTNIHIIYQRSKSGSAVAVVVEISKFSFASLVSTAGKIDISNFPFFGTLVVPKIQVTISSDTIENPLVSEIYPSNAFLSDQIVNGTAASFRMNIGTAKGVVAGFENSKLEVTVPESVVLSLATMLKAIPGVRNVMEQLPSPLTQITSSKICKLYYVPASKKLQFEGSLKSLTIVPDLLVLTDVEFSMSGVIGDKPAIGSVFFKGNWKLSSLSLTTQVVTYKKVILVTAFPTNKEAINVKELLKGFAGIEVSIPQQFNALKFTKVTGRIEGSTFSIILLAKVTDVAKIGIVYQRVKTKGTVSFAADVKVFKLYELVKSGTGVDISNVPFFGHMTIRDLSFVISSQPLSTKALPDVQSPGVPKELLLENIPRGLKGQFLMDIGKVFGLKAEYSDNTLSITPQPSAPLSVANLVSAIPTMKSTIHSLPPAVRDVLSARIQMIEFKPLTKDLVLLVYMTSLTVVPKVITLKGINMKMEMNIQSKNGQVQARELRDRAPTFITSYDSTRMNTEDKADIQAVSMDVFAMKAMWIIRSVSMRTELTYEKKGNVINIKGTPTGSMGLSITDIISAFGKFNLKVPSIVSSLKLTQVVAQIDDHGTIIIVSARAGTSEIYLVFDLAKSGSNIAVAADIDEFKLSELIKTATGTDISKVPFIGPFVISNLGLTIATDTVYSNLFASTFATDSPLRTYGKAIPKGLAAFFMAEIAGKVGVEVTYANKVLDLSVPPTSELTLQGLLSEIPAFENAVKALPPPMSDLLGGKLRAVRYDLTTRRLSAAGHFTQITIIPKILTVKNLDIAFTAHLGSTKKRVQSLEFSGDWLLRSIKTRIKVSYDRDIGEIVFAAVPEQGLNIGDLVSGLSGTTLPIPSAVNSVKLTKIVGRKINDKFLFIFSGSIAGKANVHLLYHKFGTASNIAVAVGIKDLHFADMVKSATNIDIRPVPFFGTFSVPVMALSIAKNEITTPLLPQVVTPNSLLANYGSTLPRGFTAKFKFSVGGVKGILGSYVNKVVTFTVPDSAHLSLGTLVSQIPGVDIKSLNLPPVLGDILKIRLRSFSFDIPRKTVTVEVFINKITFFENLLSISRNSLKLVAKLSPPKSLTAELKGMITFVGTNLHVYLRRDVQTKVYVITIKARELSIFWIAKQISAELLPGDLNFLLGRVFNFKIFDTKIEYPFVAGRQQILISGRPHMLGIRNVHMTAVGVKYGGRIRVIQKYKFGQFHIADFIRRLLGVSLHRLFLLNQNVDMTLMVSPVSLPANILHVSEFRGVSVSKGISFKMPIGFPPNCNRDPFCAVCQSILGKRTRFLIESTILSTKSFRITASVKDMRLGRGVVLERPGLQIEWGNNPSIGIVGTIKLKKPAITMGVAIRATVSGVKLEGHISGCLHDVFNSEYITVCDILLSVTLVPTPLPVTGLEFGGRIEMGKRSCRRMFRATGYIGINTINPTENYYYANVGRLNFQTFFNAFCIHRSLPRPLARSGFPDGFKASYSLLGKELPHARISIPAGYNFKGTIDIVGLRSYAEIKVRPNHILVKVFLPPVRVHGFFQMYASRHHRSRGPELIADLQASRAPRMEGKAFVEVLGMSADVKITITTSKYVYNINGKFLNRFHANIRLETPHVNLAHANYVVEGWFRNDLFDRITSSVRNGLRRSADEADRHIKAAQRKINEKRAALHRADRSFAHANRRVHHATRYFHHAIGKLNHVRHRARHVCHIRHCGSCKLKLNN